MEYLYSFLRKLMEFCASLTDIYPIIMIVFTFFTKIILLPISIWAQYNGIKIVKMSPKLLDIKIRYFGDKDTINEKTAALYKAEKYHPFLSIIPVAAQFTILLGVIEIVKVPEQSGLTAEKLIFMNIDHSKIAAEAGGWYILFPIFAALSSLLLCHCQNKAQVLQSQQGNINKYGILIFSTLLSLYLGFFVRCSITLYWIASNIFSIIQMYILNWAIDPKKSIDFEALKQKSEEYEKMTAAGNNLTREQIKRQNADYKRFFSIANKHLVFYSEKKGFYKYYKRQIEWLLDHSNIVIHYVTSDPDDVVFEMSKTNDRFKTYFIGQKKLITLFMKMDADILLTTTTDLGNYYLKRSYVRKDVEYIYSVHSLTSFNLTLRKKALDNYDTIFCPTRQNYLEVRAREKQCSLPEKNLLEVGYGNLEDLAETYEKYKESHYKNERMTALIAPSYQIDNILDSCLDNVVGALTELGCVCIIRPHPQYIRRKPQQWEEIENKYRDDENVVLESDFSSNDTILRADLVVSDWSSISYEYVFSTLRPCLFIDTPMKAINPDHEEIDVVPLDKMLRNVVGRSAPPEDKQAIKEAASYLIEHYSEYHDILEKTRSETVYNFMKSAEIGGNYILSQLIKRKNGGNT